MTTLRTKLLCDELWRPHTGTSRVQESVLRVPRVLCRRIQVAQSHAAVHGRHAEVHQVIQAMMEEVKNNIEEVSYKLRSHPTMISQRQLSAGGRAGGT